MPLLSSQRQRIRSALLAALVLLLVGAGTAHGGLPVLDKLDGALRGVLDQPLASLTPVRVIVTAKPGQLGGLVSTLRLGGFTILSEHPLIEAVTLQVPRLALTTLTALDLVQSISIDAPTRALATEVAPTTPVDRLRATLGTTASAYTGAGVGVAVVDSGIYPSPAFQSRVVAFYDFTTGKAVAKNPFDDYGHGTHVAGLIGGSAVPSNGMYGGVAPGVRLIGLKVLDSKGGGYTSAVISAVEYAVKNRQSLGIHVINLSLGHPIYERAATDPLVKAVEQAVRRGLIVVVSAGNYGTSSETGQIAYGGITSPGNAPSALTIGAVDTKDSITRGDDLVTPYSSRGPTWYDGFAKPDVVAPGHSLYAAASPVSYLWQTYPALRATPAGAGRYMRLSGTSMAAAVATGVVALVLEAQRTANVTAVPALTPNTIKAVLQFTALPVANSSDPEASNEVVQGAGSINAAGAIELSRRLDTQAKSGEWWLSSGVEPVSVIGDQSLSWGEHLVWGNQILWGDSVYYNDPAFASQTTWGAHVVWGSHLVWGNNVVWGNHLVWGSHIVWGNTWIGRTEGEHIVWGSADFSEDDVAWGNLATSPAKPANTVAATDAPQ
jgi:serine protease AprX